MLILPTLLKAAGTGLGILGQLGSSDRLEEMAGLNYQIDTFNAGAQRSASLTQLRLDRIGIGIQQNATRTNLRLSLAETNAQRRNAERIRRFAEAKTATSREAIRRKMRAFDEFQGSQRAAIGASGVEMSGSALEVMAESAAQFRLAIQDEHDQANFERNAAREQAGMMDIEANRNRAAARAEAGFARRGARLAGAAIQLGRIGAQTAFQSALMQAELRRQATLDQAEGQSMGALGTALSGIGGFLTDRYTINQLGMGNTPSASARPVGSSIFKS